MKLKLPKLFKWNVKISYIIPLDNIIQIVFCVCIYTTFIKRSIHKSICSNALLKTQ